MNCAQKKNPDVKYFSTTNSHLLPVDDNRSSNLTEEQKQKIQDAIKAYEAENPKPRFQNPGYPDFQALSDHCKNKNEYENAVDSFLDKHSIKEPLNNYDRNCANYVIPKICAQNPGITYQEAKDFVESEQEKQYDNVQGRNPEHQGYPKGEVD